MANKRREFPTTQDLPGVSTDIELLRLEWIDALLARLREKLRGRPWQSAFPVKVFILAVDGLGPAGSFTGLPR